MDHLSEQASSIIMRQRWLHYFFVNELATVMFCVWLYSTPTCASLPSSYARAGFMVIGLAVFSLVFLCALTCLTCIRRLFRPSHQLLATVSQPSYHIHRASTTELLPPAPVFKSHYMASRRDGVKLRVHVAKGRPDALTMLLAAPLGQCGPGVYDPLRARFGDRFNYITWDYRGLFESESPSQPRRIAIHEHAEDAIEVLLGAGFDKCDVIVGHSMGSAVSLEACLLYPQKIRSLVLLNGFHGQVFHTAFQPICRFPFMGDFTSVLVEVLLDYPQLLRYAFRVLPRILNMTLPLYAKLFGSKLMCDVAGDRYLLEFLQKYTGNLIKSERTLTNYLRLFQELNAHSTFHLLDTILQPTLLISGMFDTLIPALQSVEMARRIPDCEHYCDPFSSHASILESPEWCVAEIEHFFKIKIGLDTTHQPVKRD